MQNPNCWARSLGDCSPKISGEHRISAVAWPSVDGNAERAARLRSPVRFRLQPATSSARRPLDRSFTLANLTVNNLCQEHNQRLSPLDAEAGRLTKFIREFHRHTAGRYPGRPWTQLTWRLDGRLLERWFLKTAITNAEGRALPIGGPDAEADQPIESLVNAVFGSAGVERPVGLWGVAQVGRTVAATPDFWFHYVDRNIPDTPAYVSGCFMEYLGHRFLVCLDSTLPLTSTDKLKATEIGWGESHLIHRLARVDVGGCALRLQYTW